MADIVSRFECATESLQTDPINEIGRIATQDNDKARESQSDDDNKADVQSAVNNNVSINSSRYKDDRPTNGNQSSNEDGDSDADADRETKSIASKGIQCHFHPSIKRIEINFFLFFLSIFAQFRLKLKRMTKKPKTLKIRKKKRLRRMTQLHLKLTNR